LAKYLILLFVSITSIFALDITVKAKQIDNTVKAKVLIKHPMITYQQAELRTGDKNNAKFITHITAEIDNTIVYDVTTSPYLSKNPVLKFKYRYKGIGDTLKVIATDTQKVKTEATKVIKGSLGKNKLLSKSLLNYKAIDYRLKSPQTWTASTMKEAIHELYGSKTVKQEKEFTFSTPKYPSNRGSVPVDIQGTLDIESFAIFATNNPYPTAAVISQTPQSILDYSFRLKVKEGGEIVVIGKGKDGELYKATRKFPEIPIDFLTEDCHNGGLESCFRLGFVYQMGGDESTGAICEQNYEKSDYFKTLAQEILKKQCDANDYKKCERLAYLYKQNPDIKDNKKKAIIYFEKSCHEGKDPWSCESLAQMYYYTSDQARDAYIQACNYGSSRACIRVARSLETKIKTPENIKMMEELYQKGCDKGDHYGCNRLAELHIQDEGSKNKVLKLLTKSCKQSDKRACYKVGELYEERKNMTRAKEFYQESCSYFTPKGCEKLGKPPMWFDAHKDDVKNNLGFDKQCKENDYWACYRLGDIYRMGKGVKKDTTLAKKHYTKSCNGGYLKSCFDLAHIYKSEKHYEEAIKLFSKVCENDGFGGCYILGLLYSNDKEIEKNIEKALYFYKKDCEQGSSSSCSYEVPRLEKILNKQFNENKE